MANESEKAPKLDQKLYKFLQQCSDKKDMSEWNKRRPDYLLKSILLQGADLKGFILKGALFSGLNVHLEKAKFVNAHLQNAKFSCSHLKGAIFDSAHLEGASFERAHLEGAQINEAHLEGADFSMASVDGSTVIYNCTFDKETDFTGVGLDSCRINPGLKGALKGIIRKNRWKTHIDSVKVNRYLAIIWRLFWLFTDYGRSTKRIVDWFIGLAVVFGGLYFMLEISGNGVVDNLRVCGRPLYHTFLRAMYFSVVTMTTLGFGDLYAMDTSYWGHVFLMIQVIIGYVLLGALITQFAIMFSGEGPPHVISNEKRKPLEEWQKGWRFTVLVYSMIGFYFLSG